MAILPDELAKALEGVALAFGKTADNLDRLVNWHAPGSC